MSLSEETECLRKIPLFANIETAKLKLLAFTSERIAFKAGQSLFEQDEMGTSAFIILDGEAEVFLNTPRGPRVLARVGRNEIVGEVAILCDVPRTASVRATTDMVTLCISKDLFFQLIQEFPQMAMEIMRVLAHRLEQTTRRVQDLLSGDGI